MKNKIRVGIADCGKYENYRRWIEATGDAEAVKLSYLLGNAEEIGGCDGLVLSGGEDVQPELYGKPEYVKEYGLKEIIPERDQCEFVLIRKALELGKPLLGICRGLQVANVYLGGSLIPDIPSLLHSGFHSKIAGVDQRHQIAIEPGSLLGQVSGVDAGEVNSAHHQSADRIAKGLKVTAFADSGIVEAMEWAEPEGRSWLLLVQWHPERMEDQDSPLSFRVRKAFLEVVEQKAGLTGIYS
jgi:putative glutamine amidotransferase